MRKIIIIVVSILIVAIGILYSTFGFYRVDVNGEKTTVFVKRVDNGVAFMSILNAKPINCIHSGDLILYRDPLTIDVPITKRKIYLARVIATPGDVFYLEDGKVYLNNNELAETYPTYTYYRLSLETMVDTAKLSQYDVRDITILNDGKACDMICNEQTAEAIKADFSYIAIRKIVERDDKKDPDIFPSSPFFAWNKDNYGPMPMLKVGDVVDLTPRIAPMYRNIIYLFEGNDFQSDTYHVYINGSESDRYQACNNYFFILNDDRTNKRDSRQYGPIPESLIIGKISSNE